MNNNNNKSGWIWAIVIIVIILIGAGLYASYRASHSSTANDQTSANQASGQTQTAANTQTVNVKHQYANGSHTYAGSIDVPTPCDSLADTIVTDPTNPANITIAFTTVQSATSSSAGQTCAQVITSVPFEVTFAGPQNANVTATLDGNPLILNVFEVPAGQDINSDLYIKG